MTNEQAKQEAIKKAYGDFYDLGDEPEENGWRNDRNVKYDCWGSHFEYKTGLHRPKKLSGIHDNNGWIRIEPDGSNLPTRDLLYESYKDVTTTIHCQRIVSCEKIREMFFQKEVTHYKIYDRKKPIY